MANVWKPSALSSPCAGLSSSIGGPPPARARRRALPSGTGQNGLGAEWIRRDSRAELPRSKSKPRVGLLGRAHGSGSATVT